MSATAQPIARDLRDGRRPNADARHTQPDERCDDEPRAHFGRADAEGEQEIRRRRDEDPRRQEKRSDRDCESEPASHAGTTRLTAVRI